MILRRFLLPFGLAALVAAVALLGFNAHRGHRGPDERNVLERLVARQVAQGHSLIPPSGMDEAALRWHVAQQLEQAPEVAVLGSSHSLRISGPMLGVKSLQNFSISGGDMTEHMVTSALLTARGMAPQAWVIIVDPWFFDRSTDFGMWKLRGAVLTAEEARLDHLEHPYLPAVFGGRWHPPTEAGLEERFSLSPLIAWIDDVTREFLYRPALVDPAAPNPPFLILRSDGAYQVAAESDRPGDQASTEIAETQFRQDIDRHRYGSFERVDADLWALFERWIDDCGSHGARVYLVLTPYHPAIYSQIVAQPGNQLRKIEHMVRGFAAKRGLPVFGSYNPTSLKLVPADFFDGDHLDEAGLQRLCAPLAQALRPVLAKPELRP